MKKIFSSFCLCLSLFAADEYRAQLDGHIVIPSESFINAPEDAPEILNSTGKFAQQQKNNITIPFKKQALQGHSGVKYVGDNMYWVLSDNGLGTKKNSLDSMLFIHKYFFDFTQNTYKHLQTIFFNDKNKKFPYPITLESDKSRYLTGADLDPESFQVIDGNFWVGDEFGPFLLEFDSTGMLKEIFEVSLNEEVLKSPDNPTLTLPQPNEEKPLYNVKRSKGIEAMASSQDGSKLYLLLEGALYLNNTFENEKDKNFLRIIEFDIKNRKFTGKSYKYFLENNAHSIGDFNMIDENYGLIIERDDTEGTKDKACKIQNQINCFKNPANFKRVYKIKLDENNNVAQKIAYIDLMNINDENKISQKPLVNGKFVFPFFTIESVDIVDATHIIVGNDNNFPFSSSREPNKADDNEFILLEVKDFLNAQ